MILTCKNCKGDFGTGKKASLFCSIPCAAASRLRPRQPCERCAKPFYARPCRVDEGGGRFCSHRCAGDNHSVYLTRDQILARVESGGILGATVKELLAVSEAVNLDDSGVRRLAERVMATTMGRYVKRGELSAKSDGPEWRAGCKLLVYRLPIYANAPIREKNILHAIGKPIKRTHHAGQRIVLAGSRPDRARPAPVTMGVIPPTMFRGKEVDYSRAKYSVIPSPKFDARFQVDAQTRVVGGFATLGIGRYLDALPFPSPGAHSPGPFFVADELASAPLGTP